MKKKTYQEVLFVDALTNRSVLQKKKGTGISNHCLVYKLKKPGDFF